MKLMAKVKTASREGERDPYKLHDVGRVSVAHCERTRHNISEVLDTWARSCPNLGRPRGKRTGNPL